MSSRKRNVRLAGGRPTNPATRHAPAPHCRTPTINVFVVLDLRRIGIVGKYRSRRLPPQLSYGLVVSYTVQPLLNRVGHFSFPSFRCSGTTGLDHRARVFSPRIRRKSRESPIYRSISRKNASRSPCQRQPRWLLRSRSSSSGAGWVDIPVSWNRGIEPGTRSRNIVRHCAQPANSRCPQPRSHRLVRVSHMQSHLPPPKFKCRGGFLEASGSIRLAASTIEGSRPRCPLPASRRQGRKPQPVL